MTTSTADEATTAEGAAASADPDAERVVAALVRDLDDGFAELVRTYQGLVYAVALRTTGHRADAEALAAPGPPAACPPPPPVAPPPCPPALGCCRWSSPPAATRSATPPAAPGPTAPR